MMHLGRYPPADTTTPAVGVRHDRQVTLLRGVDTVAELLRLPLTEFRDQLDHHQADTSLSLDDVLWLPPVDGRTEVWASGVTYERFRGARTEESIDGSCYEQVYDAARPELFLTAPSWLSRRLNGGQTTAEVVNAS